MRVCSIEPLRLTLVAVGLGTLLLAAAPARAETVVRQIDFYGVHSLPERDLLSHMLTRRPDRLRFWRADPKFSKGALEEDLRRIERVYRDHGYYSAKAGYGLQFDDDGKRVSVEIYVAEGEPVRLVELVIELEGDAPTSVEALGRDLPLVPGDVFTVSAYRDSRAQVLVQLAELAHPAARIEGGAEVDVEALEARVHWTVTSGPFVRIGPIRVSGLDRVDEKVVRREIRVVEGEPYTESALDRTRRRLVASQLFRYVAVQPERESAEPATGAESVWPIAVEVSERPPRSIAIGGGWSSGLGPRGSVRWTHRNFLGDARRVEIGVSGSPVEQLADVRLLQPYFLGTLASLESNASWRRTSRQSYDANTISVSTGPRRSFGKNWVGEAAYRFGWTGVTNVRFTDNEVLREQMRVGFLSGIGIRARRAELDRPADPTRGTWLQLGVATNLRGMGSDFDWMHYEVELRGYLPLGPTVLAARVRLEAIDPFGPTQPAAVPLGERLFLGGPHMGRGFPYEKLGPLDAYGDPVGGVTSVLGSLEWRFPVWRMLGASVFVDAGQVSLNPFELYSDKFGVGTGAGLTFATPIGPIAGYVGYPVLSLQTKQEVRFAVTVGHSF